MLQVIRSVIRLKDNRANMPRNFQKSVVVLIKLVILISVGFILSKREYLYTYCYFSLFMYLPMFNFKYIAMHKVQKHADTIRNFYMVLRLYGQ